MVSIFKNIINIPTAIVLGLGTNGLCVARALGGHKIPLIIVEKQENCNQVHLKTRYGKKEILPALVGRPLLVFLGKLTTECILFPTTDEQVSWLSQNRGSLPANIRMIFPDNAIVQELLDKEKFFEFCTENGFLLPPYFFVNRKQDILKAASPLQYPLIIKAPQKVYKKGLAKAYIVDSAEELVELWQIISKLHHEFVVQEYIAGTDADVYFCLQYISQRGELLASFTGRKIRQWRPLCGGTASCEPADVPSLCETTFKVLREAGFHGIGSMEYKFDKRSGRYYIVEPTVCRTDFQEQVAIANGVNIPFLAYCDACGLEVEPKVDTKGTTAWMHVMHDRLAAAYYIKNKTMTRKQWFHTLSKVRSFDLFSVRDPLPSFAYLLRKFEKKLRNSVD